ncbi:CsgG/HfaB family protein [Planctomycetota bacterium]
MVRVVALVLGLSLVFGSACSEPEVQDEPTYEDTDVQAPAIQPVATAFMGKTIAIVPFVNKTLSEYQELGDIAPDVLSAFCIEGGWRVIEGVDSGQLEAVSSELAYGQSEYVKPETAVKIGKHFGAQYVLVGAVTNFRITKARRKKGVDVLGLVEVGGSKEVLTFDCQVSGRIVSVETREIIAADSGTAVKQKYEVGGSKTSVLFVKVEDKERVEVDRDSFGKILKIAFARSLNKLHGQTQMRAAFTQP